jgi:outer membrane protein assembly factor BamA
MTSFNFIGRHIFTTLFLVSFSFVIIGQNKPDSSTTKNTSFFALPLIFSTPETSLGFGAAGILSYRQKELSDTLLPSQIQFGFAYTLNKQLLSYTSFQLYFDENKTYVYGELGYYIYNYNFYGIGNSTPSSNEEQYDLKYPRFRINALRNVAKNIFVGARYWGENITITSVDSSGVLSNGNATGAAGGITSGIGPVMNYDTRNSNFWPTKGVYAELGGLFFGRALGSDYSFQKFSLDISSYHKLKWNHVVAFNTYTEMNSSQTPFNLLAFIGGTKRMRGYYEGRFRDQNVMMLQAEYRAPLFCRIGMVAFGGIGQVSQNINDYQLNAFKWNAGAGLRIRINDDNLNIRIDYGIGQNSSGLYLTLKEAF